MPETKPQRADARRNRALVLDGAAQLFAKSGLSASMPEIASHVGVGVGTIYRHFPTKAELFRAVLVDRMGQVIETARGLSHAEDPGQAFRDLFAYLVEQTTLNRALFEALSEKTGVDLGPTSELGGALMAAEGELLGRAQAAGAVRRDIDVTDLKALLNGCLAMANQSDDPDRMVAIVMDGLRP